MTWEVWGVNHRLGKLCFYFCVLLCSVTFTLRFDEAFMSKRFWFWPTKFSSTHHGFSQAAYVSAFESMLVAVVLTAEIIGGSTQGKAAGSSKRRGFFSSFSPATLRTKIIPFARQTIIFKKSTSKKDQTQRWVLHKHIS